VSGPTPQQTTGSPTSAKLCLLYLLWAPLGPEPLRRFLDSYRRHPAGAEHVLAVAFKGFRARQNRSAWERELEAIPYERLEMSTGVLDLGSYREVVELIDAERYCFLNTNSEVLCAGWLGLLDRHLLAPGTGLVGTSGSFESAHTSAPRPLRPFRRDFPPFPNPHIRTNGFALQRELLVSLRWPPPRRKLDAWRLESSRVGLSRQVLERGLKLVVVGRDGLAYPPERWRESATFRSGNQVNQMLADNRTREYQTAPPPRARELERMAWGPPIAGAPGEPLGREPLGREPPGEPLGREPPGEPLGQEPPGEPLGREPLGGESLGRASGFWPRDPGP
jgi:hypothetical protein